MRKRDTLPFVHVLRSESSSVACAEVKLTHNTVVVQRILYRFRRESNNSF